MRKKIFYFIFLCVFLSQSVCADYLDNIEKCQVNGRESLIYRRDGTQIVDLTVIFRNSGSAYEEKNGVNDFALSMINMGSKNYTYRDFQNKLDDLSAVVSFSSDQDHSYLYIRSLKKNLSKVIDLAFESLFEPNFSEENLQIVKNRERVAIREREQDHEAMASYFFKKEIFKSSIYEPQEFTEEDLNKISIDDVKDHIYKKLMNASIELAAVGDLDEKELKLNLESHFMKFGKDDFPSKKIDEGVQLNLFSKPVFVKSEGEKAQTIIHFAQRVPEIVTKDFVIMSFINDYIGGAGLNSKLMKRLREELNITYSASTNIVGFEKTNYMGGHVATGSDDIKKILDEINNIFKSMIYNGLTQDELDYLKMKFYGRDAMSFSNNISSLRGLVFLLSERLPLDFYREKKKVVDEMTVQDVKRVASKFLDVKDLSFVVY